MNAWVVVFCMILVCLVTVGVCAIFVAMNLKLYTEIMKEKVISSRIKQEHECFCAAGADEPVTKGVSLNEAVNLARQIMDKRKVKR